MSMNMSIHICISVSYTHLRAHETVLDLVCRLLLEKTKKNRRKKKKKTKPTNSTSSTYCPHTYHVHNTTITYDHTHSLL